MSTTSHATDARVAGLDVSRDEPAPASKEAAGRPESELAETLEQNLRKVREYIEKNPVQSAAIAFAAGVVLSSLLRR
ncbi:MAG TPA: hypothetical protein VF339_04940 [Gammaproteobacteria bacterium]